MTGRANLVMDIGTSIMTVVKGQHNPFLHVWNREMDLGWEDCGILENLLAV